MIYLKPVNVMDKYSQLGFLNNLGNWFNKKTPNNPSNQVNQTPYNIELEPTMQQQNIASFNTLDRDLQTLTTYINQLTKDFNTYRSSLMPLYDMFNNFRPHWMEFKNKMSNPQFQSQIRQNDLNSASAGMKKVLPMIAQMISEQKQDNVQSTQILQNTKPVFESIAKLVGAQIPYYSPNSMQTNQPISGVPIGNLFNSNVSPNNTTPTSNVTNPTIPPIAPQSPAARNRDPRGRYMKRNVPTANTTISAKQGSAESFIKI